MALTLERLIFDPSDADNSPNLGAYLRSSDGTLITHTTEGSNERLDVSADLVLSDAETIGIYIEDAASAGGENGQYILGVRRDADTSPVSADGDFHGLVFDDGGRLKVATLVEVQPSDAEYAQDAASSAGDTLISVGAVREDSLTEDTSADGDYSFLKVNNLGQLYTVTSLSSAVADDDASTENPILSGGVSYDQSAALSALSAAGDKGHNLIDLYRRQVVSVAPNVGGLNAAVTVGTTAVQLDATAQAGRQFATIQNNGDKPIFIGFANTVTTSNGIEISKGGSWDFNVGEAIELWAISASAAQDVRVIQIG